MEGKATLEEGFLRKGDINYRVVLLLHINRISSIISKMAESGMPFNLITSVSCLEQFLKPYIDSQYEKDKKMIEKKWQGFYDNEIKGKPENVADPKKAEYNKGFSLDWIGNLCMLMGRKNLLIELEGFLDV